MHVAGKPLAYGRGSDWGPRCSSRIRIASISTPRRLKALAASSVSVATETKAAIERSLRPVQDRSISQVALALRLDHQKAHTVGGDRLCLAVDRGLPSGEPGDLHGQEIFGMQVGPDASSAAREPLEGGRRARRISGGLRILEDLGVRELAGGAMRHQVRGQDHARQRGSQGEDRIDGVAVFAMQQRKHALEAFGRADVLILIGARRAVDYDGLDTERAQPVDAGFGIARALRGIDFVGDFVENRHGLALVNTALTWLLRYDDR